MCPVIRIPDDVYQRLEGLAEGLDTPANVIEKLLNHKEGKKVEQYTDKKSNKINKEIIESMYLQAKAVYEGELSIIDAQAVLVDSFDMDAGSARYYINNFQKIMAGECYQRTMNGLATNYFLEKIHSDFGNQKLRLALDAIEKHIDYYETFGKGKLQNIRKIHEKFRRLL